MSAPVAMSCAPSATPIGAPEAPVILAVSHAALRQADPGPTRACIRRAPAATEATHGWPHRGGAA